MYDQVNSDSLDRGHHACNYNHNGYSERLHRLHGHSLIEEVLLDSNIKTADKLEAFEIPLVATVSLKPHASLLLSQPPSSYLW